MDLLDRVRETGLLIAQQPVVVLLSGGRDSVALLDIALELGSAARALHVNHGLRGEAADADEAHCRELCDRLGVELEVEHAHRPDDAGNTQAWARDVRYGAGAGAIRAAGADARLATGHTLTDQSETILYRLAVSPGRRALLGMPVAEGLLVRPLLAAEATRDETAQWCRERALQWREDASNQDPAYARSRVRHSLLAAMREVHPLAEHNVLRTAEILRDEAAVLDEVVATALDGRDRIALDKLAALPPALSRLVLRRLAEDATGGLCARAAGRLDDVLALPAGALDLGDGARAVVRDGVLRVTRTPPR